MDETITYEGLASGFPALKYFRYRNDDGIIKHYVLIAGGMNPRQPDPVVSSKVKLLILSIESKFGQLILDYEKSIDYELEGFRDYFPHNQWINADNNCQDYLDQGSGSYLILGTRGVYQFTIDLGNPDYPEVTYTLIDQSIKYQ